MKPLKRVVIKEELVELTGDFRPALILNQFIYWSERMYDADKYILEEKERALKEDLVVNIDESKGWIYKTAEELSEELMTGMSKSTVGRYIKQLVEAGYLMQRRNPKYKWDKTYQYRVNLYKIQLDLGKMGYVLEGYKLLPNIKIVEEVEAVEEVEDIEEKEMTEENKKSLTYGEVKDNENENLIDDNIVPQNEEKDVNNFSEGDVEDIAYRLCLEENPNFDTLEDWRKDFFIGMKISKLLRGDI